MRRWLVVLLVAVGVGACHSDDSPASEPAPCKDAQGGRVTLVAQDTQWDTDCLRAPAGDLTIIVDNRETDANHNVHLPDAPGSPATDLVQGPATARLEVTLVPGEYEYICDIHSNMVGTLTVR